MINMQQLSQMLLALFIGFCGSILFIFLHLPLPWLLGAIFTTSIAMRFENLPIQSPKIFSAPARILIGLIIGSAFTPQILEFLHIYLFSILLIIPYSIIVTFAGMYYYVRFLRFDRKTAFFSSTPGGVVEMVILGEEQKADTSKITLVQSSRLLFVVLTLPFIIQYVFHLDISGNQLITKALKDTNITEFFYLIVLGTFGALLAKKLRMSAAFLIGPMIFSVIVYSGGFVHTLIPDELIKFVQVIFGTIIGFTFKGVKLRMIIKTLMGTFGHFVIIVFISAIFVYIAYHFFGFPIVSILLAFSPGGQTEMNLIALIVGANVPYITIHHIMRLFIVMNLAPMVAKKL